MCEPTARCTRKNSRRWRRGVDAVLPRPMPEAAFYLWANVGGDDAEFARRLYAEQAVSVLPGSYLGRDGRRRQPGRPATSASRWSPNSTSAPKAIDRLVRVRAQRLKDGPSVSARAVLSRPGAARRLTESPATARVQSAAMATMSTPSGDRPAARWRPAFAGLSRRLLADGRADPGDQHRLSPRSCRSTTRGRSGIRSSPPSVSAWRSRTGQRRLAVGARRVRVWRLMPAVAIGTAVGLRAV